MATAIKRNASYSNLQTASQSDTTTRTSQSNTHKYENECIDPTLIQHTSKKEKVKYVVHWCGYGPFDDTVKAAIHILKKSLSGDGAIITRNCDLFFKKLRITKNTSYPLTKKKKHITAHYFWLVATEPRLSQSEPESVAATINAYT